VARRDHLVGEGQRFRAEYGKFRSRSPLALVRPLREIIPRFACNISNADIHPAKHQLTKVRIIFFAAFARRGGYSVNRLPALPHWDHNLGQNPRVQIQYSSRAKATKHTKVWIIIFLRSLQALREMF